MEAILAESRVPFEVFSRPFSVFSNNKLGITSKKLFNINLQSIYP